MTSFFKCIFNYVIVLTIALLFTTAYAKESDYHTFDKIFSDWTTAFNNKQLETSCALFAKNVVADYRGTPQKNYDTICNGFKKIFADKNKQYHYRYKLHYVYSDEKIAAARITWYLQITENGKTLPETQDEGLDVFRKDFDGKWVIENYLGYEVAK